MQIEWWQIVVFLIVTGLWSEFRYIRGGLSVYANIDEYSKKLVNEKAELLMKESYDLGFKEGVDALNAKMQDFYKKLLDTEKEL